MDKVWLWRPCLFILFTYSLCSLSFALMAECEWWMCIAVCRYVNPFMCLRKWRTPEVLLCHFSPYSFETEFFIEPGTCCFNENEVSKPLQFCCILAHTAEVGGMCDNTWVFMLILKEQIRLHSCIVRNLSHWDNPTASKFNLSGKIISYILVDFPFLSWISCLLIYWRREKKKAVNFSNR